MEGPGLTPKARRDIRFERPFDHMFELRKSVGGACTEQRLNNALLHLAQLFVRVTRNSKMTNNVMLKDSVGEGALGERTSNESR